MTHDIPINLTTKGAANPVAPQAVDISPGYHQFIVNDDNLSRPSEIIIRFNPDQTLRDIEIVQQPPAPAATPPPPDDQPSFREQCEAALREAGWRVIKSVNGNVTRYTNAPDWVDLQGFQIIRVADDCWELMSAAGFAANIRSTSPAKLRALLDVLAMPEEAAHD